MKIWTSIKIDGLTILCKMSQNINNKIISLPYSTMIIVNLNLGIKLIIKMLLIKRTMSSKYNQWEKRNKNIKQLLLKKNKQKQLIGKMMINQ